MMKVVLVGPVPPFRGGIAHYTYGLYQELRRRGVDIQLISFKRQYPDWLYPGKNDRSPGREDTQVPDAHYWIDSLNPFSWLTTFFKIRKARPTLLVIPWWTPFWAPAWITLGVLNRLLLNATMVFHCHNVLPHESRRWHRWITRLVLRWGDRYVVHSQNQATELKGLVSGADVRVCPLPANTYLATGQVDRAIARSRLGIGAECKVVLFFGIVRPYKGLHVLLDAMVTVLKTFPDAYLVIAGEFWEAQSDYDQQIAALGISSAVIIHNTYVPDADVPYFFSSADVLAVPYISVTGSAVANMAQPFGTPVVMTWDQSSDSVGVPRAYHAQPGDVDSLALALVAALSEAGIQTSHTEHDNLLADATWVALGDAILVEEL